MSNSTTKIHLRLVQFILSVGVLLLTALPLLAQDPQLVRHFDYNKQAPLGLRQIGVENRDKATIYDITYASPKGGLVPAYLVVPKGKGPFAGVIWGHWYWGNAPMRNRKQFLDEAVALAQGGVVSLLTDGPIARPGHVQKDEPLNEQEIVDLISSASCVMSWNLT